MIKILANIGYLFLLINIILFFRRISTKDKALFVFTMYNLVMFVIQNIAAFLKYLMIDNLYLSHFYFIFQFVFLSFFYFLILKTNLQRNIVKVGLVIGLLALSIQYLYNPHLFYTFNLFEVFITSFLIIIYATFHLYNLLGEKKEFYYINAGVLMYLFSSTILFLVGNLMTNLSNTLNKITWIINAFLYILYQLFILIEWRKTFYKKII
jgi:hypothetical protein